MSDVGCWLDSLRAERCKLLLMVGLRSPLILLVCSGLLAAADSNESIFRDKILPTLQASCASCHGGAAPASSLAVSDFAGVLTGGKHGPAITPGNAAGSLLIQYLRGEKSPKMPVGGSIPEPTIAALAKAIDEMKPVATMAKQPGRYSTWLFSKPQAPKVPPASRNPIDAFIQAKLEARNLSPAPPASKRALIRRVYFDLIGLPPTPQEVDEFAGSADPQAYEKIIDRLLADPRYGERWGRHWLDWCASLNPTASP